MSNRGIHPLGEMIKEAIKKSGITQARVADRMGVPRQTINQIDTRKTFDLEFLQKLKNATGLDFTNHVFDPKGNRYVAYDDISKVGEPAEPYQATNSIELSLALKINAQQNDLSKLSELISAFKNEAQKFGFVLK